MENEPVSFYQIDFLARSIARKFKGDKITHVIGLARGGLIPATIISYQLNVPLLSYAMRVLPKQMNLKLINLCILVTLSL